LHKYFRVEKMRWTLNVNQKQSLNLGIKNINQSIILGLICDCHSWAEAVLIEGEVFYWTSRQSFARELPLLDLKADTIYRHLKIIEQLGLIEYKKDGKKDCVRLTKLGKTYYVGNESEFSENSEMNPNKLGNESENNSEMNPTYNNTNSNPTTSNNISDFPNCIDKKIWEEWVQHRKEKKNPLTPSTIKKQLKQLEEFNSLGMDTTDIINASIAAGYVGLFPLRKEKQSYQPKKSKFDISMETYEEVQEMKRQQANHNNFIDGEIA